MGHLWLPGDLYVCGVLQTGGRVQEADGGGDEGGGECGR